MERGLPVFPLPLSDWPLLPYPLTLILLPYWSTGDGKDMAAGFGEQTGAREGVVHGSRLNCSVAN